MKIDYDIIKKFLEIFEESEEPTINTMQLFDKLGFNHNNDNNSKQVWFYLKLLTEQDLIECVSQNSKDKESFGFSFLGSGEIMIQIVNFRLTIFGHQTLESMKNHKIWDKIKDPLKKIGIEGLKQIPSLSIKVIEAYFKSQTT